MEFIGVKTVNRRTCIVNVDSVQREMKDLRRKGRFQERHNVSRCAMVGFSGIGGITGFSEGISVPSGG